MARGDTRRPLMPSVLDRLIDLDPSTRVERTQDGYHSLDEMRSAVRRDLENLLNTRSRMLDWPDTLPNTESSVLNYGIPDVSGQHLGSLAQRLEFLRQIENLIRKFERRFRSVKVELRPARNSYDRTLNFAIHAEVDAEPAPEPLDFDSVVDPVTRQLKVDFSSSR